MRRQSIPAIGANFIYHDIPPPLSVSFLVVAAVLCVVWGSPFVVHAIVILVRQRFRV